MDTGIIGPVTVMNSYVASFGSVSSTVHGLIVSSILIPAAISSFFAGKVADILGRPKAISVGAFIFGLGAALEAGAADLAMFIVGRCVEGIGEGLYLGTLVVYVRISQKGHFLLLTRAGIYVKSHLPAKEDHSHLRPSYSSPWDYVWASSSATVPLISVPLSHGDYHLLSCPFWHFRFL